MSKYETVAGIPTRGATYAKMVDHLREAQDCAAVLAHLYNTETKDRLLAQGWLGVEELLKRLVHQITELAKRGLQ